MPMNDEQLIEYVRLLTKARPVQVADRFDIELEDARSRLDALVDAGDLLITDGFSPNGVACKVYDVAHAQPEKKHHVRFPVVAVTPKPELNIASRPHPADDAQEGISKVQKALNFLTDKGEATADDLRAVMDLDRTQSPSAYLVAAIRNGLVVKDGNTYRIGEGKPTGVHVTRQKRTPSSVTPNPPPVAVAAPSKEVPTLRIGLWSDGVIELQRDGKTVACFDQAECRNLIDFLSTAKVPQVA